MRRQVKGILFLDYVRMLKAHKGVDWASVLEPGDLPYLEQPIDRMAWYPMESFERMGNAILTHLAGGDLVRVQRWGRFSAVQLGATHPRLLAPGDPVESLGRFKVMRQTFFDFDALEVLMLHEGEAEIEIRFHMGRMAEEAASVQTMGFFEGLLDLAGAREVRAVFAERSWTGDARTLLSLRWSHPD